MGHSWPASAAAAFPLPSQPCGEGRPGAVGKTVSPAVMIIVIILVLALLFVIYRLTLGKATGTKGPGGRREEVMGPKGQPVQQAPPRGSGAGRPGAGMPTGGPAGQ